MPKLRILKGTITSIIVSFFFSIFVVFLFYLLVNDKVVPYLNSINNLTLGTNTKETTITFDNLSKRLIKYPTYGTVFAKINIPKINLELPVYNGDTLDLLKYGAGHMVGSYFPGEGKGIVIDAHNSKGYFEGIYDLNNGDKITLNTDYGTFTYEMYDSKVIYKTDIDSLKINTDDETLMLYTCYPRHYVGLRVQRYVIYAKLVEATYA